MSDICGAETTDGGTCEFEGKYPDGRCGHHTDTEQPYEDRDSKLTKQRQEQIASAIEQGRSMQSAARRAGITPQTVYNWLDKGEGQKEGLYNEFFERITHARGEGEEFYMNLALQMAKENGDHRFIASLMKQRYPDSWGETETGVEADKVELVMQSEKSNYVPNKD
jgi:transposase-like protein